MFRTVRTDNTRRKAAAYPAGRLCRSLPRYILIICALCLIAPAWTESHARSDEYKNDTAQEQGIDASQAARIARERHGGKVLKVSRDGESYLVKLLLPSGAVRTVRVDASGN